MHERSPKNEPLNTILYEIEMLRHCAIELPLRCARAVRREATEGDKAGYHLYIEGFLLHLRNLLGFFTAHSRRNTDLIITRPQRWLRQDVDERKYVDLVALATEFDTAHGTKERTCYGEISIYLQHCTTYRHEVARQWSIEKMAAEIEPILQEFEQRFVPQKEGLAHPPADRIVSNSTFTPRVFTRL